MMNRVSTILFRIYGYPAFGLVIYLILILINPVDDTIYNWRFYSWVDSILECFYNLFYASLLFETGIQLSALLNKWLPWEKGIKLRFVIQLLVHISIVYIYVNIFFSFRFPDYFHYDAMLNRQILILGVLFSILITVLFAAEYFFYRWKDDRLKSLEIEQHSTQAQLDALKLQLDPHFLFNNLSTVTALLEDRPAVAIAYISKLSSIYRYMLTNRTQNVIPLKEELEFIKSYLFLYQIRYGQGIKVCIEEIKDVTEFLLPPLTLQLLIENAIKHNVFSTEAPLTINILFPGGHSMIVENNKKPKTIPEPGTNIGLRNILERYRLVNAPAPIIMDNESCFRVEVPLIC